MVGIVVVNIDNCFDVEVLVLVEVSILFVGLDNCEGVCVVGEVFNVVFIVLV